MTTDASAESSGRPFYITTPIYYVNDRPHVGSCYTTIVADCIARFMRLAGRDVFFLTGTDEHGQKVEKSAAEKGKSPQELADENARHFREAFEFIGSTHDDFIRTTEDRHEKQVQEVLKALIASGDIYLGEFEGWYDEGQEEYVTENQARERALREAAARAEEDRAKAEEEAQRHAEIDARRKAEREEAERRAAAVEAAKAQEAV